MDISKHPVWNKVSPYKKPLHILRLILARNLVNLYPRSNIIGITGSVGKTTTKQACLAVLSQKFKTIATEGNIDPIFNIPVTITKLRPNIQKAIFELGVEYPGEMEFYLSLIHPQTAIVTRIYFAHSEFLGNIDNILEEKGLLIKQLPKDGFAILNWDDLYVRKLAKDTKAQVIFYGSDKSKCDIWASDIRTEGDKTVFALNYGVERAEVTLKLLGRHFVTSALAAAALGITCGLSLINIRNGLNKLNPAPHRLQLLSGIGGWSVLDDTYNSSPIALEEALNVVNELPARRRILVLGEMRELGIYSEKLHKTIAQKIYKDKFDLVLLGIGDTKYIAEELIKLGFSPERLEANLSNSQMVGQILKIAKAGDIVLVKGSRAVKLDEVVKRITQQK